MAIGRLPVRTPAEADTVLQKILDYEQIPPPGDWRAHSLFIADRSNGIDDFEAREFERINDIGSGLLSGTSYSFQHLRYWSDNCIVPPGSPTSPQCDALAMRAEIQDAINGVSGPGPALIQYTGHGNFDWWSSDKLFCANDVGACGQDDTELLTNGGRLPWLLVHNCLSSGFYTTALKSFGEQWLKHDGGGAVAVFAPSGLGFRFLGEGVTETIWTSLFGPAKERSLSIPVLSTLVRLCTQDSIEGCQFYTLLGDPALTLGLPSVHPPTGASADGGNAVVDLSWTPSVTPDVTYHVYRTWHLDLPYVRINAEPVTCSSSAQPCFSDTDVVNGQSYFYSIVAVDAEGFESAWSNPNQDCPAGPECLRAQPVNLTPPAVPGNVQVYDAETGGRLVVSWSANPEPDIKHYTIHWGTTPALGSSRIAYAAPYLLGPLQDGTTYYVAVSATNTSLVTSALSAIHAGVPSLVLGIKAPDWVGDLRLGRVGEDALLTWGAVTADIHGKPVAIAQYEVYRSTSPVFQPTPERLIGLAAGASFVDGGALAPGGPDYFYRVRAMTAAGHAGGFGGQLPQGIGDLLLERPDAEPSKLRLFWTPVITDFDGAPTAISHYEVYAGAVPFRRADIEEGSMQPVATTPGPPAEVDLPAESRYYSVIGVDARGNRSPF
jgi:hypothetical protein